MHVVTNYPDGVFNWVDLSTTDIDGAKAFYGGLFGWFGDDIPLGDGAYYTMFRLDGHAVAGLTPMSDDMKAMGAPPVWVSYVKIDAIDAAAERAAAAGGNVFVPPMDVMDSGRMALLQDPTGAAFGMWSPRAFTGAELVNQPNTLVWNELQTRDLAAARTFYGRVFGWEGEDSGGYISFSSDGRSHCGTMPINEMFPADMPSHWAVYFMVEDIDAAAARVAALGGQVLAGPAPAGEMGRFIVARDPQGAVFHAIELAVPADPPPGA